jgi:trimeric autotransporter adhesin
MIPSRFLSPSRTRYAFAMVLCWLFAGLLSSMFTGLASAATNVSGSIISNTTWTLANQPYTVTADVIVDGGATLTVEAGVTIYMNAATNLIVRNGALNARGTSSSRIVVTSSKDIANPSPAPAAGDWGSIRFEDGTLDVSTALSNGDIRYGSGIVIQSASPLLENLNITQQNGPAISVDLLSSPQGKGLAATGNKLNGIRVPAGDIVGSIIWGLVGIPYILEEGVISVGRAPISLTPASTTVVPGVTVQYTVQLGAAAPTGGLTLDVVSSVPSVATVPTTITVAAGATSAQFVLNAVAVGYSTITVSKLGLGDATAAVRVDTLPTIVLSPAALTLGLNKTRTISVALSQAAPTGGLTLNISSSNTAVATAPATLAIAASATSGSFDITTVGAGNATITAAGTGYANGTTAINVRPVALSLPVSTVVAPGSTVSVPITLTEPAPGGGLTISVTSGSSAIATAGATVTVAAGASAANVNVTGVAVGNTTLTAAAPGYDAGTGNVVVDSIALDFQPTGNQTIAQGLTQALSVRISKAAPAGGVSVDLAVADMTKATIAPTTVTIPAGQTASSVTPTLTGVAPGATTLTATSPGLTPKTINVTVTNAPQLTISSAGALSYNKVGKGLRTANGYYSVQRTVNGNPFYGTDPVTVTLTSSDPTKLTVPATITIPANQYIAYFSMTGVGITTAAVQIDAAATGYPALAAKLPMQVVAPEIVFVQLDNTRSSSSARDDFYMRWNVTDAWDATSQVSATDISLGLTITEATPSGIISGFYDVATGGTAITSRVIAAGQSNSYGNVGFNYVGVPTQSGSYKVTATATGIGSWSSAVQTVTSAQLVIVSAGDVSYNKVGKGLSTAYGYYSVQRAVNGSAISGADPVTVTLTSSDPTKLTVPATVTIPANQSTVYFAMSGVDITTAAVQVDATATGYTAPAAKLAMQVVTPEIVFVQLDNARSSSSARDDFYMRWNVTGAWDSSSQVSAADISLGLSITEAAPTGIIGGFYDAATGGSAVTSRIIAAGQSNSYGNIGYSYVGVPTQSGSYKVTATVAGIGSWSSVVQNVTGAQLIFSTAGDVSYNKVGKGLQTNIGYYSVQRALNGVAFNGTDAVTVTLTSSDPSKLTVPATITIPANQSTAYFSMTGVSLTTASVLVDATAAGFTAPAVKLAMQVVSPEIVFVSLDGTRSSSSARDDFYMRWNVTGAWDSGSQQSAADVTLTLSITEDLPAGIIGGIYDVVTGGSPVTSRTILAGSSYSQQAPGGYNYIGVPTQSGSYKVTATASGLGAWSSAVQTVTSPQLRIYSPFPSIKVGKGLKTATGYYYVERIVNGNAFAGPDAVTVNLACASTVVCSVPATVTIPANQAQGYFSLTGEGLGSTTVGANAVGYLSAADNNVDVITPDLQLVSVPTTLTIGATANFYVRLLVTGAWDSGSQTPVIAKSISLTSSTPSVASTTSSVMIAAGANNSANAVLTGVASGATSVTASATETNTVVSPTITVTP